MDSNHQLVSQSLRFSKPLGVTSAEPTVAEDERIELSTLFTRSGFQDRVLVHAGHLPKVKAPTLLKLRLIV